MLTFNNTLSGGGGGGVTGSGTPLYIPIWTSPTTLGDSHFFQAYDTEVDSDGQYSYLGLYNVYPNTDPLYAGGTGFFATCNGWGFNRSISFDASDGNQDNINFRMLYFSGTYNTLTGFFYNEFVGSQQVNEGVFYVNNAPLLTMQYFNEKTLIRSTGNQLVPFGEDNYTLYVGSYKKFGFGGGGNTGNALTFSAQWLQWQPDISVNYNFPDSNVVGGLVVQNKFRMAGGGLWTLPAVNGQRTVAGQQIFNSFELVSNGYIISLAGLQILGLYQISNSGGYTVSISDYYAIYINDSNEYGLCSNISVANRYGIYQAGFGDKNVFNGLNSFVGNIGFFSVTPSVQQNTSSSSSTVVHNVGGTNIKTVDTFDGYTIAQVVKALRTYGLLA